VDYLAYLILGLFYIFGGGPAFIHTGSMKYTDCLKIWAVINTFIFGLAAFAFILFWALARVMATTLS